MARILIGNIKGPQGPTGPRGETGPQGPVGPQGPLPPLTNNGLATVAGVSALDAVMGKTLSDKDADLQRQLNDTNSNLVSAIPRAGKTGPRFDGSDVNSAAVILYKISDENWAAIGCDGGGRLVLRQGTANSYQSIYSFGMDGIYLKGAKITN